MEAAPKANNLTERILPWVIKVKIVMQLALRKA